MANKIDYSKGQIIAIGVLKGNSSLLSIIGSSIIIFMILRRKAMSCSLRNRLIFMMCITDILFSMAIGTSVLPMPPTNRDGELTYGGFGNDITCQLQGFFLTFMFTTPSYNAMLCLYYLAVIKYRIEEEVIRRYGWVMHAYAIVPTLVVSIGAVSTGVIHAGGTNCGLDVPFLSLFRIIINLITVINGLVIISSMIMTYLTVRSQEKAAQQYSFPAQGVEAPSRQARRRYSSTSVAMGGSTASASYRKTYHQALLFVGGYILAYIWQMMILGFGTNEALHPGIIPLRYCQAVFLPLQGFCNFLAFVHPKFVSMRRRNPQLKFFAVLKKVIMDDTPMRAGSSNNRRLSFAMPKNERTDAFAEIAARHKPTSPNSTFPIPQISAPISADITLNNGIDGDNGMKMSSSFDGSDSTEQDPEKNDDKNSSDESSDGRIHEGNSAEAKEIVNGKRTIRRKSLEYYDIQIGIGTDQKHDAE